MTTPDFIIALFDPTFRTKALILVHFLSVQPHIALSQELQQVQVLVGQIEPEEPLARDGEPMHPHKVVEDPPCSGGLDALAFVVRQGDLVLRERVADAIRSSRRDEHTDRHDHQQGHDTCGFFQRQRRGQKLWGFAEAQPACCPGLAFGAVAHRVGGSVRLVQCVRREEKTALRVDACPMVRARRREGPGNMGDHRGRRWPRPWAPPRAVGGAWGRRDGRGAPWSASLSQNG
jgi:hypothetical protein